MPSKRNPYAKAVTRIKPNIVRPKKGKGSKKRPRYIKVIFALLIILGLISACNKVLLKDAPIALKPNMVCAGGCFNEPDYVYAGNLRFYPNEL